MTTDTSISVPLTPYEIRYILQWAAVYRNNFGHDESEEYLVSQLRRLLDAEKK